MSRNGARELSDGSADMSAHYHDIAFTPAVKAAQTEFGSRDLYARADSRRRERGGADRLGPSERAFIGERDGFYLATVSEDGWPYAQFRGGPPGFVRVLDDQTLAWDDYRGNLQYISSGNLSADDRLSLFFMDYARQRRLKLFGRASARPVDGDEDADDVVEQVMTVTVEAFDWNCPQHIAPRYTIAELQALGALA